MVVPTACLAMCVAAPVAVLYPEGAWFGRARARRVRLIWSALAANRLDEAPGLMYRRPRLDSPDGP